MPSPTSSTRPTSVTSWPGPSRPISPRRTETISSGLNFIAAPRQQLIADRLDLETDRAIEDLVANLNDHPAQERRVDLGADDWIESGCLPDGLFQLFRLA